ncbi:class I SAM-dependent methyltransferase [Streptomyces roseoviridis]|uniref:Methyltransferase domain-containing protein n=1 Tax=Streptomyces roseoviridis TaxID=67361 RepID=A0ABV5QYI4_9ACTN
MTPQDALLGWDEDANALAYEAFTRTHPMYNATSSDLARRVGLADSRLVVDLCGGSGATARAILDQLPAGARLLSVDNAAAMQRVGKRTLSDDRLSWITAPAEQLAAHVPTGEVDAVVCNSAIWKTQTPAVFDAVARALRPGGLFAFNIGGGFAGVRHPDEHAVRTGPSLNTLINQVAARDHGYTPPSATRSAPMMPLEQVAAQLAAAGLTVVNSEVTAQHSTMAEKKAWLSIPVFARPADRGFTHAQRMEILEAAYALTTPDTPTVTSWLVVVAQRPADAP